MTTQNMIELIDQRLRGWPVDRVAVVWQLVQMMSEGQTSEKTTSVESNRDWFDVDAFLAWRRNQRQQDLELDMQRTNKLAEGLA
jgi:hypothetical protein